MPNSGVHNPNVIDLVSHNPKTDIVTLGMVEERAWDKSNQRLLELEAKIQAYFSFIVDGQFAKMYPNYVGKRIELRLFCLSPPDNEAIRFIEHVRSKLVEHEIDFAVSQLNS